MANKSLKLAIWNANGLSQHRQEIQTFLSNNNIDIMLISETHFTYRSYMQIPKYYIYDTKHPDGTAHGGTAIIIKRNIRHHQIQKYEHDHLQATSVSIADWNGAIIISAIYCPPRHTIDNIKFSQFFNSLGNKFIAGGDYNAKHLQWGSRLTNTRGRELLKSMQHNNLGQISTAEPTYWPTDRSKIPDLLDFCITKGISTNYTNAVSSLDLSSDHSPVIVTLNTEILQNPKECILHNKATNWNAFRERLIDATSINVRLKIPEDIDNAVQQLNENIQEAAWKSTPTRPVSSNNLPTYPFNIMDKIAEKRKLRKKWQTTRSPNDKLLLNRATKEIKKALDTAKNKSFQGYLEGLSPTATTDYSLWKATKKLRTPTQHIPPIRDNCDTTGKWARNNKEKAEMFGNHLTNVFKPFPSGISAEQEKNIIDYLEAPHQMELPIKKFKSSEVKSIIKRDISAKKSPGYDLITGRILKELPDIVIQYITLIFNAVLRIEYFPAQWKVGQIIMIRKPGKKDNEVQSYRPISLLPILSKLFEKALLERLRLVLSSGQLIPAHQFGFRKQHATVEQIHRVVEIVNRDLERQRYCSAAFLDISQAFDKVWHTGLLYKLKSKMPHQYYQILKSYLEHRYFLVKVQDERTKLLPIEAGVPQGSVLGPLLYLLYTADLPTRNNTEIATFADDTVVMASHRNPKTATKYLQENLTEIQQWLTKWRMKVNEAKSTHVTFTLKKETCPPVVLNGQQLPQATDVKYLGMYLDRRLTWKKHIFTKRKHLGATFTKMYWLMGRKSKLSLDNKLLLYKTIIKPIWTYGIQLWGTACNSNIEILQRFQSKVLRNIVNAPWYVPNTVIQSDLKITSVKDEIKNFSKKYEQRLSVHPNELAVNLLNTENDYRRLKRFKPSDLITRF